MKYLFIISLILAVNLSAQEINKQIDTSKTFWQKNFTVSGEIGAFGEAYSMSGSQDRRPKGTGRLYIRPTLTLFNLISIPIELFVSTEGSGIRQDMNRYGIAPQWAWGKLYLGDFTENYSEYSLSGISIRGAGVNLYPGNFRFALATGLSRRQTETGAIDGSFDRFIFSAKLGYGTEDNSHFYLTFLRGKDKISKAPITKDLKIVFPNGNDEISINSLQTIKWYSTNLGDSIKIMLSRDGGSTYELIANTLNTGFYNWNVTGPETFNAILKIISLSDTSFTTQSTMTFRIGYNLTTKIGTIPTDINNVNGIAPAENLLLGFNGQINLLDERIKVGIEGNGSVYTRDIRASEINIDSAKIPAWLKSLYTPRISSNIDFAVNSFMDFNFQPVSVRLNYKYIGPGYNSMGLSYVMNDQQEISVTSSVNLYPIIFFLNFGRINDNLINQKTFTTARNVYGFGASAQVNERWNLTGLINFINMGNNSNNDTTLIKFNTFVLNLNNMFKVSDDQLLRNITLNYSFQNAVNSSFLIKNGTSDAHTVGLNFMMIPTKDLTSSFAANLSFSKTMDTIKTTTQSYTLNSSYPLYENKWINTLSLTESFQAGNSAFNLQLSSNYALTLQDAVNLIVGFNKFSSSAANIKSFNEVRTSLSISHRF